MSAQILIYGFGPFGKWESNITESIVGSFSKPRYVTTRVFEVKFDRSMFLKTLTRVQPQFIIGLGLHGRARKLRIERHAQNWMVTRQHPRGIRIDKFGPAVRCATLSLPKSRLCTRTYDAGTYVCNYSMWVMSSWCERHNGRWAFLHVPPSANPAKVEKYLLGVCRKARLSAP